jgi:hypothetical protein
LLRRESTALTSNATKQSSNHAQAVETGNTAIAAFVRRMYIVVSLFSNCLLCFVALLATQQNKTKQTMRRKHRRRRQIITTATNEAISHSPTSCRVEQEKK